MTKEIDLTLSLGVEESAPNKQVVIGHFPGFGAERDEFVKAHVRFFDGDLFHNIFDALICASDEFSIGGRKVVLENGAELWVVKRGTEKCEIDGIAHFETPNVQGERRAEGASVSSAELELDSLENERE